MCLQRGNDPASGHPRAHQPPLGRGTSPPAWDGRLDAPGQRRRHLPSSAWTRRREVKQGKSGGSVGTTDQGNGKGRSVVRPMGTAAYRGKGQGKGKGRGEGRSGKEEEEGQMVVRSRWAPPPMEGKGPREGQRMAIGQ